MLRNRRNESNSMIKKLLVSLLILFSCDFLYAQIDVQGTVEDVLGIPQISTTVYFRAGLNQANSDSVLTDSLGFYAITLSSAFYTDSLFIGIIDCDSSVLDTFYSPSALQPPVLINKNFTYCASTPCTASFSSVTNGLNATFTASVQPSSSYNFFWDIGNGGGFVPGGQVFSTTFNSFGPKGVCLNVQSISPGCNLVVCDTVEVTDSVFLVGQIQNLSGQGIPNKQVIIAVNGAIFPIIDTVITDSSGQYNYNFRSFGRTSDSILVSTTNCLGFTTDSIFIYDLVNSDSVDGNMRVCDSLICNVNFLFQTGICDTVSFQSVINSPPGTQGFYTWDFGDSNGSSQANPTHVYNSPGTYIVCLQYQDPFCVSSICYPVQVNPCPPGCTNSFTSLKYDATVLFDGSSNYPNPSASFEWDFGDGNSETGLEAIHTYSNPGIYNVCFSTIDGGVQCSFCDTISVSFDTSLARISGTFAIDNQSADGQILVLYRDKGGSTAPFIEAIDTTISDNGAYAFYDIIPDSYIVKAIPDNPNQNPGLLPKYWNNSANPYWANAASILITSSLSSIDFDYVSSNQSISGPASVEIEFKDNQGNNLSDATIWLVDLNGDIVRYGITGNSNLLLNDLAYGTYYLRIDYAGYYMLPYTLTLLASDPNPRREFILDGNLIITSLNSRSIDQEFKIYPNPFADVIHISGGKQDSEIRLYDVQGKEIDVLIEENSGGLIIRASNDLKKGFYLLEIFDPDRVQTFRLMKN